jgi:hypothetical protein
VKHLYQACVYVFEGFFWQSRGLNSGLHYYNTDALLLWSFWRWDLPNYLSVLVSKVILPISASQIARIIGMRLGGWPPNPFIKIEGE